jgi:hypothetical protein
MRTTLSFAVIPVKTGIQVFSDLSTSASAGVTTFRFDERSGCSSSADHGHGLFKVTELQ